MPYNPKLETDEQLVAVGKSNNQLVRQIFHVIGNDYGSFATAVKEMSLTPLALAILAMPENVVKERSIYQHLKVLSTVVLMGPAKVHTLLRGVTSLISDEKEDLLRMLPDFFDGDEKFFGVVKNLEPEWPEGFAKEYLGAVEQTGDRILIPIKSAQTAVNRTFATVQPRIQLAMIRARENPRLNAIVDEAVAPSNAMNEPLKNIVSSYVGAERKKKTFWGYFKQTARSMFGIKKKPRKGEAAKSGRAIDSPVLEIEAEEENGDTEHGNGVEAANEAEEDATTQEDDVDELAADVDAQLQLAPTAAAFETEGKAETSGIVSLVIRGKSVMVPQECRNDVTSIIGKLKQQESAGAVVKKESALTQKEASLVSNAIIRAALDSVISPTDRDRVLDRIDRLVEEENELN